MRTCFVCRAAHFLAQKATEATGITAKALFGIVTAVLAILCLLCPFAAHAEDMAQCSPELEINPLQGACQTLVVDSENRPRRARFLPDSLPHSHSMGQEAGEKGAVAVGLQPTIPKSDWLLVLANIVKRFEPPPFRIISLLSGGRVTVVMPPKLIINKLMDGVIVLVASK